MAKHYTTTELATIRTARAAGQSAAEIGKLIGRSEFAVQNMCARYKIDRPPCKLPAERHEEARQLVGAGTPVKVVARRLGVSASTILRVPNLPSANAKAGRCESVGIQLTKSDLAELSSIVARTGATRNAIVREAVRREAERLRDTQNLPPEYGSIFA